MKLTQQRFAWQDDYFALSISQSHVDRVRAYIRNQDEHHKKVQWEREQQLFIEKYGFYSIKD